LFRGPSIAFVMVVMLTGCGPRYRDFYAPSAPAEALENFLESRLYRERGDYERALMEIDIAIEADPGSARLRVERADLLRLSGNLDAAARRLDNILDDFPEEPDALYIRALIARERGDVPGAIVALESVLAQRPEHSAATFMSAELSVAFGDRDAAAHTLEQYLQVRPDSSGAWLALANLYWEGGDFRRAADAYEAFIDRDQRSELAFIRLAQSQHALGDFKARDEALADCVEAVSNSPSCKVELLRAIAASKDPDAFKGRMDTLVFAVSHDLVSLEEQLLVDLSLRILANQPLETSNRFVKAVLRERPGLSDLAYHLGIKQQLVGDHTAAVGTLEHVEAVSALFVDAQYASGQSLLALGRIDDASRIAASLVEREPELSEGYRLEAELLWRTGELGAAGRALAEAHVLFPKNPEITLALADVTYLLDDRERAVTLYTELASPSMDELIADADSSDSIAAVSRLASLDIRQGHIEPFLAHLSRVEAVDPAMAATLRGDQASIAGEWDEAALRYQEALTLNARAADALVGLGALACASGERDEGIHFYRDALDTASNPLTRAAALEGSSRCVPSSSTEGPEPR